MSSGSGADSEEAARAVGAARTLSGLVVLGCGIGAASMLWLDDPFMRRVGWGWLVEAGIGAVAGAVLLLRRRWTAGEAEAVSLLVSLATVVTQVHADWTSALSGARFSSFEGFKILALAVATLVPFRRAWAHALLAACAALPLAVYAAMTPAMRAKLPAEEPWIALIYPLLGAGILAHRVRDLRAQREVMRARAEREALERLASVALACRDLANSPLQSIELVRAELVKRHPDSRALLDVLRRSLVRLRGMSELLAETEHEAAWTPREEAFDAAAVIAEYRAAPRRHPRHSST